jgi:hypothetical protein
MHPPIFVNFHKNTVINIQRAEIESTILSLFPGRSRGRFRRATSSQAKNPRSSSFFHRCRLRLRRWWRRPAAEVKIILNQPFSES